MTLLGGLWKNEPPMPKRSPTEKQSLIKVEPIEPVIRVVRGQRVVLDADLAEIYGVATKVLNQAVRRNSERFPADFMFRLTAQERDALRSQIVTSRSHGGRRYLPYACTEHGAVMAANVLSAASARAEAPQDRVLTIESPPTDRRSRE